MVYLPVIDEISPARSLRHKVFYSALIKGSGHALL